MKHLETNKILTNLNHGFRSGYSCKSQLLTTINDLLKEHDKGHQVDVAILDFSKAFDTVPHNKLLHKLDQYGIKGSIHNKKNENNCRRGNIRRNNSRLRGTPRNRIKTTNVSMPYK